MIRHTAIGFLYTRTCPLRCRHCITRSNPDVRGKLAFEDAARHLEVLPHFTDWVSFTGGEPLLQAGEIVRLVALATRLRLSTTIVTGSGWAKNEELAKRRVDELARAGLRRLVLSWDRFHAEWISADVPASVARLAIAAGISVDVALTLAEGDDPAALRAPFRDLAVRFPESSLLGLGEAEALSPAHFATMTGPPRGACDSVLKAIVEEDGEVYACCGPAHFAPARSPLRLGNANREPLEAILRRSVEDPVLETIARIGPYGLHLLDEAGKAARDGRSYRSICDLCLEITGSPETMAEVRRNVGGTDARKRLAAARLWASAKTAVRAT